MSAERHTLIVDVHLLFCSLAGVLLGVRQNTGFGDGLYHPPSGHLEAGESIVQAAVREAYEEVGVVIDPADLKLVQVSHRGDSGRLGVFFEVHRWQGEIQNMEPHLCGGWEWFPAWELPDNMIAYSKQAIQARLAGSLVSTPNWPA